MLRYNICTSWYVPCTYRALAPEHTWDRTLGFLTVEYVLRIGCRDAFSFPQELPKRKQTNQNSPNAFRMENSITILVYENYCHALRNVCATCRRGSNIDTQV